MSHTVDHEKKIKSKYKRKIKKLKEDMARLGLKMKNMEKFYLTKIDFLKRSHDEEKDKLYKELIVIQNKYTEVLSNLVK